MHIDNLYKNQDILLFRECYALEKTHGTSANVRFEKINGLTLFAGGASQELFIALFDTTSLLEKFTALSHEDITVYGEAYGGKMQGMSHTYGKELRFIAFEVRIGRCWLSVPDAANIVGGLGLEFVPYTKTSTDLEILDMLRDSPSEIAKRRGIKEIRPREGIVLRPLIEVTKNNGDRIIAKHKGEAFQETRTKRSVVSLDKQKVWQDTESAALEWVTPMRLQHVLDGFPNANVTQTGDVVRAMLADIEREGANEIEWNKETKKAVSQLTVKLFKQHIINAFREDK